MIFELLALSAIGAPERLAILPAVVEGSFGRAGAVELFELVAKAADFRQGLEIVPYNALFLEGVEPVATTVRDCGSDLPCIARALAAAGIDLGLRVIANFALDPPLITMNLIVEEKVIREVIDELDDRSLASILEGATELLLWKYARGGRLAIEVSPSDAAVTIDPPAPDKVMAPGRYRVAATREGYAPDAVEVEIAAGAEQQVRLALAPLPEESSIVESPWLWTGVGAGVVAIVAAVLIATNPFSRSPTEGIVCVTTPSGACP